MEKGSAITQDAPVTTTKIPAHQDIILAVLQDTAPFEQIVLVAINIPHPLFRLRILNLCLIDKISVY